MEKNINSSNSANNYVSNGKSCSTASEYFTGCLKHGMIQGITYQVKILTWVAWKLLRMHYDDKDWFLGTEVHNAIGFHDLVLKYKDIDLNGEYKEKDGLWMYRFVQIKHKLFVDKDTKITITDLKSKERKNQYSLLYLFQSYLNMLGIFEKITSKQIVDMTVFTNAHVKNVSFLRSVKNDKLFDFHGRGKRYRIDLDILCTDNPEIMERLRDIKPNDAVISDFLNKLIFAADEPSEFEIEGLMIKEMSKVFEVPQILYNDLYKNIIEWFLIYRGGKAPYLTLKHLIQYMKNIKDMLQQSTKKESRDILTITELVLGTYL